MTPESLSFKQIEDRSHRLLINPLIEQVGRNYLIEHGLGFGELYRRVIRPRYGIEIVERVDLQSLCGGYGALGAYCPDENEVLMDVRMSPEAGDPRRTFTLYHEACGHGVLQGDRLRRVGSESVVDDDLSLDAANYNALEWQANTMAAVTAAPSWLVDYQLIYRLQLRGRPLVYQGPGEYHLGPRDGVFRFNVVSFADYARAAATLIAPWFHGLSITALGFRVERSAVVSDGTLNGASNAARPPEPPRRRRMLFRREAGARTIRRSRAG
jgi:hypothetical protein